MRRDRLPAEEAEEDLTSASFERYRAKKAEEEQKAKIARGELLDPALQGDEEYRQIKADITKTRFASLESTRKSVQVIKETEDIARNSMHKLREQTEQLSKMERDLVQTDENMATAYNSSKELKKYSGLIPISIKNIFGGKKKKQGDAEYTKALKKLDKQEVQVEKDRLKGEEKMLKTVAELERPKSAGGVMEHSSEDDKIEREIDENLEEVVDSVRKLKIMSMTMLNELDYQDKQIGRLTAAGDHVEHLLIRTTKKLENL